MIRGTTPTHTFNLPIDTKTIKTVRISYKQKDTVVFEKTEKDVTMLSTAIKLKLSQEDTLLLKQNTPVQIQLKVLTSDDVVMASPIKTIPVEVILNEEVLE